MESDAEEEEWVHSSVLVEQYGYSIKSITVLACEDRKKGRTDRAKKVGYRLYFNLKKFTRRPCSVGIFKADWRGKDPDTEYGFNEIAKKLGMELSSVYRAYESGMRKIAKALSSQSPL